MQFPSDKFELADGDGKEITPPAFDALIMATGNVWNASVDGKWGRIGPDGSWLFGPKFEYLSRSSPIIVAAMDAKRGGSMTDALLITGVSFLDVEFLEFFERLVKHYVPVEHIFNHRFEAGADLHSLVSVLTVGALLRINQSAVKLAPSQLKRLSRDQFVSFEIASRRGAGNLRRQFGTGRLLIPFNAFQIIAHVLLVERWLRLSDLISVDRPEA